MIRILALLLATAFIAASPLRAQYDEGSEKWRIIFSDGSADTLVKPDKIIFFLAIEARHLNIDSAKAKYQERMAKLIELTQRMQIASDDIRMDLLNIEPGYLMAGAEGTDFNPRAFASSSDEPELQEYYVGRSIVVTLYDHSRYTDFLSELLRLDIELQRSPLYQVSNTEAIYDILRIRAIRNAKERAEKLASEVGMQVLDPLRISETNMYDASEYAYGTGRYGGGYGGSEGLSSLLTPDLLAMQVSINVTFEMVAK